MTEQIKPEIIKKTQESLGKFIKKPVLTEKLLTKPPFRFLHDICTAAMRETGFFEGVLTSFDIKSENIKDKDGKIAFLQKVIAAVETSNSVKLPIKPNKVVAGHEPIRTNEFLQELAKALEKHLLQKNGSGTKSSQQSKPQVQAEKVKERIKLEKEEGAGKKKIISTKQSKKELSSEEIILEDKSKVKPNDSSLEQNGTKKTQSSKSVVDERVKNNNVRNVKPVEDEKSTKHKERSKVKILEQSDIDPNIQEVDSASNTNKKSDKSEEKHALSGFEQDEYKRPLSAKPGHRKTFPVSETVEPVVEFTKLSPTNEMKHSDLPKVEDSINRVSNDSPFKRPGSSFIKLNKTIPVRTRDSDKAEDSTPSPTITEVRPPTARPASARPAAPKIRDRGEITIHEDIVKPTLGNVPIIIDNKGNVEPEDDENLVLVEPENVLLADELGNRADQFESNNEKKTKEIDHGLLVEQILETQKELDQNRLQVLDNKIAGKTEIEWQSSRNRESTEREIKKLRTCIQTLTRSTNPLGKLLDFLEEDIDIMQKELTNWTEMNSNLDMQIAEEQSLTEQSIEPLKVYLKELQQVIDQQLEQIVVIKGNILRNDQKLQKLLTEMRTYWDKTFRIILINRNLLKDFNKLQ